ncbi:MULTISPECIES: hypothetical protein [unclassified Bradyrhizobium]|uniref:hypothetical protein n=1 Tax=unclassified Bradyrhizobium TaxID=2631580 RepID=UPI0028EC05AC|nr:MULTISPECIES: hypothetical protein [unclassified Bradyrhizobium]
MDAKQAEAKAYELIFAEISRQNEMWGALDTRRDVGNGELFEAGVGQLDAVFDRRNGDEAAFDGPPQIYPEGWSGFRSYGGDIPNIIVGVAFLIQETKRLLMNGEDPTRLSRRPDQPYNPETGLPATIEA